MKKILTVCFLFTFALFVYAEQFTIDVPCGVTTLTLSSTNVTAGSAVTLPRNGLGVCRLYLSGWGAAATTNGNLVVYLSTSKDGTIWDTAASSGITVAAPANGAAVIQNSARIDLTGVKYLREGRLENLSLGTFTNIVCTIASPEAKGL